ncbi:hypothetical protein M2163_009244 [Streptomyces sp. SAI-135]|uniref:hypothetical protein n=1 Tax=unclassified Streptomyces TaxID=2593676 RepID=UPI002472EE7F|nr:MULTISPECIES: hypothetical protein [unclassified Streptomyces]MDH6513784.1 hypothetical protein [Streptomyces sp. SAI-090]MDH6545959.1 hypothetical protein [Streptomyces sp. SAI-041]MDH6565047.1 hypothetical protein [Streptomyces sp. SAI-117]MDH6589975.1 hypothetical protein [Streptomyces sp. SAI-133]MDH6622136.1 hypothetical protein [Streptomyces sp. SAI-135]
MRTRALLVAPAPVPTLVLSVCICDSGDSPSAEDQTTAPQKRPTSGVRAGSGEVAGHEVDHGDLARRLWERWEDLPG